ncbi:MAG: outer membrane beta-barrel protein [Pseudohongiellaceae bacterium]
MKTATRSQKIGSGTSGRLSLLILVLVASQLAVAADNGWYAGLNYGQSRADVDDDKIVERLLSDGFTSAILDEDEEDMGYKYFGGYQFNRNFALEGGYFKVDRFGYYAELLPSANMSARAVMRGVNIDLVGMLPFGENFSGFGRAGAIYAESRDEFWGNGPVIINPSRTNKRETSYKFGGGLQYDFTEKLAMRLEAERYHIDDAIGSKGDIDLLSLGLVYRFGGREPVAAPPAPVTTVAPRPAAPAPAPAPTPPAPPAPARVTLSADALFDFDSSTLRPAGRAELDLLAADLRGVDFDTIQVTGHTDRIGSQAYNLRLSNERATVVKDYLVNSANIAPAKISTRGVSGADPVTTAAQCGSQLTRAQSIVCLAPDRRVEVEVTGTRPR